MNSNNALLLNLVNQAKTIQRQPIRSDADITAAETLPVNTGSFLLEGDLTGLAAGQRGAVESVLRGFNILLTGPAGTGKSHTIKRIKEIYEANKKTIGVTSTTGASALLIEGKTIHSWSGIGICAYKDSALKRVTQYTKPQQRIRSTHLLIIDEVSMMPAHLLDILDYVFRIVRNCARPFGGMQIVLCGDFFQLSPVKCNNYAFEAECWKDGIQEVHELTEIFRQTDMAFCKALNEIRVGEISQETMAMVKSCIGREFKGDIKPTELFPVNQDVSAFNDNELYKLATPENPIRAIDAYDELIEKPRPRIPRDAKFLAEAKSRLDKECLAPAVLELCVGAQVMLTKNIDLDAGLANGSRGILIGFAAGGQPVVKFVNDVVYQLQVNMWVIRINETCKIRRTQFPLRTAWSISQHKAQGVTLDLVRMDLGSKIFADGQTYTAISRARTLEGLSISHIDWDRIFVNQKVKAFYNQYRHPSNK